MIKPVDILEPPRKDEIMLEMRAIKNSYAEEFDYDSHAILDRLRQRDSAERVEGSQRVPRRIALKESA